MLEFTFKDFIDVMIPNHIRIWILRGVLLGIPTAIAAFLVAYTVIKGG